MDEARGTAAEGARRFADHSPPAARDLVRRLASWVVFWVRYFYSYCDFTGTLACAVGGFFETIFYSIPQVLARVLGVPVLVLLAGFAVYRAVKAHRQRRRPGLGARRHSGEQGPLGST